MAITASKDAFKSHFATENELITPVTIEAAKFAKWTVSKATRPAIGQVSEARLDVPSLKKQDTPAAPVVSCLACFQSPQRLISLCCQMNPRFKDKLDEYLANQASTLPTELLQILASYQDLLYARTTFDNQDDIRAISSLHIMNHIAKTRQRVLKNNEALASNPDNTGRETRDQGFTRPKALILLPMRNSAIPWIQHLMNFSLATQVENKTRFLNDFSLPEGVVDKLATDERDAEGASKYPRDHRESFKGNIDDTFRVGMKVTRKSVKLYSEFYQSDLIIASPLGLRTSIENQK